MEGQIELVCLVYRISKQPVSLIIVSEIRTLFSIHTNKFVFIVSNTALLLQETTGSWQQVGCNRRSQAVLFESDEDKESYYKKYQTSCVFHGMVLMSENRWLILKLAIHS